MDCNLVVLFEHPEWQKPLWARWSGRGWTIFLST